MACTFSSPPRFLRSAIVSGGVILTAAVLGACGSADTASQPTEATMTIPVDTVRTSLAPSTTELPPLSATETITQKDPSAATAVVADGCAPEIGTAAAAARDTAKITPPVPAGRWHAYNSGGEWCPGLSWIEVDSPSTGAPVRAHQLLIYHAGRFQGTGITCDARQGQYVLATTRDAITVRYGYQDPTDPEQQKSQGPVGAAVVTFRWNGSRVVMDGSLPYAFTQGKC